MLNGASARGFDGVRSAPPSSRSRPAHDSFGQEVDSCNKRGKRPDERKQSSCKQRKHHDGGGKSAAAHLAGLAPLGEGPNRPSKTRRQERGGYCERDQGEDGEDRHRADQRGGQERQNEPSGAEREQPQGALTRAPPTGLARRHQLRGVGPRRQGRRICWNVGHEASGSYSTTRVARLEERSSRTVADPDRGTWSYTGMA